MHPIRWIRRHVTPLTWCRRVALAVASVLDPEDLLFLTGTGLVAGGTWQVYDAGHACIVGGLMLSLGPALSMLSGAVANMRPRAKT